MEEGTEEKEADNVEEPQDEVKDDETRLKELMKNKKMVKDY